MYEFFKRILDLFVSLAAIVLLLPIFAAVAVAVKLSSPGPVIFRQERAGRYGKPFCFYKFRTMKTGSDPFGPSPKNRKDDRLTGVGRFLREYSLDELPQLFNVLKGQMSLVGPRPLYMQQMAEWDDRQQMRIQVKPGITGLAQISGRGGLTREEKLELDAVYVEKRGFFRDLMILLATLGQVLGRRSVYENKYSENEYTRGDDPSSTETAAEKSRHK